MGKPQVVFALVRHTPTGAESVRLTGASALVLCEEEEFNHIGINLMGSRDIQILVMNICIIIHMTTAVFN